MFFLRQLLDIPSLDPDDARRRKLLNIMLIGVGSFALLALFFAIYSTIFITENENPYARSLLPMSSIILIGIIVVFIINRFWKGWLASVLFLLMLTFAMGFAMSPNILVGSSLFFFTIPILMASALLRPWASYIFAVVCSILVAITELNFEGLFPFPFIAGLFIMAAISWLIARSLESALQDLRILNIDLEMRVQERTRELSIAYAKLKELDRLKSRFVSMVSHELRTPLSAIQGFTEMMEVGVYGAVTDKHQGALDRIKANTQRLLDLVNDLLDQARMDAGRLSLHTIPFSLTDLVNDMEATMRVLAEAKDLRLTTQVAADVPETLQGDTQRLHQILVNLINNSLKFTRKGGVDVRIYCPDADHWALDIADTGPGIPEGARKTIFEPFQQVDNSVTREHTGSGLGLAIVKQLAELMGGYVRVVSEIGVGSTFSVILPFEPPQ